MTYLGLGRTALANQFAQVAPIGAFVAHLGRGATVALPVEIINK